MMYCGKSQLPSYLIDALSYKLEKMASDKKSKMIESGEMSNYQQQITQPYYGYGFGGAQSTPLLPDVDMEG